MPDKTNDVVKAEKYNEAIEKVNSEKMKREKVEEKLKEMQGKEEARKVRVAEKKKTREEGKWKKEGEEKDKRIKELEEKAKAKPNDPPNPKGVVQTTPPETNKSAEMLDERYGKEFKHSSDMSPRQRLAHFKNPTTQTYNPEKLSELIALQASAQRDESGTFPEKFHNAQKKFTDTEIIVPQNRGE